MTIDPRFERSVRRYLRAYPRRWRLRRADEMVALLADLADPGATRVDVRTAAGLVRRGGRHERGPGRRCGTRSRTGCSTVACPPSTADGSGTTWRERPPRCGCSAPSRWCWSWSAC